MTLCVSCNAQQANLTLDQWNLIRTTRGLRPVPATIPPFGWEPPRPVEPGTRTIFNRVRPKVL